VIARYRERNDRSAGAVARASERSPLATASSERPKISLTAGGFAAGESAA